MFVYWVIIAEFSAKCNCVTIGCKCRFPDASFSDESYADRNGPGRKIPRVIVGLIPTLKVSRSVGQSVQHIRATIGWIAMKCCVDNHGPQRMKLTDFWDP